MNKVNAEMQEHGDMVMLPVSHLGPGRARRVSSSQVTKTIVECWGIDKLHASARS